MLSRSLILITAIVLSSTCHAETPPTEKTSIKVYRAGDLVSADAINSAGAGKTTAESWASEYPKSLNALDELCEIIETMCSDKPAAVKAYPSSLSLIVRHTDDGHKEVAELLQKLGEGNPATIQLECDAVYWDGMSLDQGLEAEMANRMLTKSKLNKSEWTELLAILPNKNQRLKETIALKPGCRTRWGNSMRPLTATARIDQTKNRIEVRIDFIAEDYEESTPFGSQTFSLSEDESGVLAHYCDGGTSYWLVRAKKLK